jgi:hypothetical protein
MKIANKCDNCGKEISDLILTATYPKIKHYCKGCCEEKGILISPRFKIAQYLA